MFSFEGTKNIKTIRYIIIMIIDYEPTFILF